MMIAARLAGGNLFFAFFGGDFFGGGFWEHSEHSEHLDFFEGICGGGILFLGGWWGCFGL